MAVVCVPCTVPCTYTCVYNLLSCIIYFHFIFFVSPQESVPFSVRKLFQWQDTNRQQESSKKEDIRDSTGGGGGQTHSVLNPYPTLTVALSHASRSSPLLLGLSGGEVLTRGAPSVHLLPAARAAIFCFGQLCCHKAS